MLNSHLVLKQEDSKACGDLDINITICRLPRVRLLRPASQRPGYAVSPLPHLPWTLEPSSLVPSYWLMDSSPQAQFGSPHLVKFQWLFKGQRRAFSPRTTLTFHKACFPVLFRQARDSCAPFRAPASVLHLSAASRMSECSLKGTFVPVES